MRSPFPALLLLAACNPGVSPARTEGNGTAPVRNQSNPAPAAPGNVQAAAANDVQRSSDPEPKAIPGVAEMSPYRRREYERGYRDCMSGSFDPERQGESYRIGCMAAEDARAR